MLRDAPNLNYLFAGLVVEELIRNGVEWFVVCPGSRSAPLAWAIASHPRAKTVVHHDERGAAFHALGLAKGSGKPAVFVCTSGSAVANALPAVVEASHAGVPMILLTADRPPRLQGTGANQTIDQDGIYGSFVRRQENFVVANGQWSAAQTLITIDDTYTSATGVWPGPVHLNCMMDDPLTPEAANEAAPRWDREFAELTKWEASRAPFSPLHFPPPTPRDYEARNFSDVLSRTARGLLILGQLDSADHEHVEQIVERLQWPVLPDVTSNFRLRGAAPLLAHHALHGAERLVGDAEAVIHLGGPITTRRLLDAVARFRGELIRVSPADGSLDPNRNVTLRIAVAVPEFRRLIEQTPHTSPDVEWIARAKRADDQVSAILSDAFRPGDPASEPAVARAVSAAGGGSSIAFLGNSMPIRDMDLFGCARPEGPWVEANRGASGIDGNIATAAGIARATEQPVTAVIGDLAALHDLNSLALVRDLKSPFVLVVVNNDGGGIFSLLPIAKHTEHFERFFGTPHGLQFEHAAAMYGLAHYLPRTNGEFSASLATAIGANGPSLIEVRTNREENVRIHRELDAKIRAALDKLM